MFGTRGGAIDTAISVPEWSGVWPNHIFRGNSNLKGGSVLDGADHHHPFLDADTTLIAC